MLITALWLLLNSLYHFCKTGLVVIYYLGVRFSSKCLSLHFWIALPCIEFWVGSFNSCNFEYITPLSPALKSFSWEIQQYSCGSFLVCNLSSLLMFQIFLFAFYQFNFKVPQCKHILIEPVWNFVLTDLDVHFFCKVKKILGIIALNILSIPFSLFLYL